MAKQSKAQYTSADKIDMSVAVKNTSSMDVAEVVQAYIEYPDLAGMPLKELKAFKK